MLEVVLFTYIKLYNSIEKITNVDICFSNQKKGDFLEDFEMLFEIQR